jgi:phage tail tape-measure protein
MAGIGINPATGYAGFNPRQYGIEGYGVRQGAEALAEMGEAARAESERERFNRSIISANRAANMQLGSAAGAIAGAALGAKVGAIGGPVGAIVGSVIGGLLGRLF